jgi:hypothetical protein
VGCCQRGDEASYYIIHGKMSRVTEKTVRVSARTSLYGVKSVVSLVNKQSFVKNISQIYLSIKLRIHWCSYEDPHRK